MISNVLHVLYHYTDNQHRQARSGQGVFSVDKVDCMHACRHWDDNRDFLHLISCSFASYRILICL